MRWAPLLLFTLGALAVACHRGSEAQGSSVLESLGTLGQGQRIALADRAITRLDVAEAAELLSSTQGPAAARTKARLAIYQADCEGALAHLATEAARQERGAGELLSLADRCHGATAGGVVVSDEQRGIWIRFQDSADTVLAPLLLDVIDQARARLGRDLGVDLPRPLRLDLVRDLFSLSAVSGLPVDAAETTGTVAVARWGRVTMISPRAMSHGYPWADTLAHELTHLMLSRATLDRAPLWLQEGIAKREEELWREPRPFDSSPDPQVVAARAQAEGQSVGITKLGPSIAMLPTADAAAIAFAEVSSFMSFWIQHNGPLALPLLLRELAYTKDADSAMRSVSGLSVEDWEVLYRQQLMALIEKNEGIVEDEFVGLGGREMARKMRLAQLLHLGEHYSQAADVSTRAVDEAPHVAALRFLAERARLRVDASPAPPVLGQFEDVREPHAGWLALKARAMALGQSSPDSQEMQEFALALDPLLPEAACGGSDPDHGLSGLELSEAERRLCDHVRSLPPRGSR